jgi:hypothetical protein
MAYTIFYALAVAGMVLFLVPFFVGWIAATAAVLGAPFAPLVSVMALWFRKGRAAGDIYVLGVFKDRRHMLRSISAMRAKGFGPTDIVTFEESSMGDSKKCRYPRASRFLVSLHLHHDGETAWAKSVLFHGGARMVGMAPEGESLFSNGRYRHGIHFERAPRAA